MNVSENVKNLVNFFSKPEIQASYQISKKLIRSSKDHSLELNYGLFGILMNSMREAATSELTRFSGCGNVFKM
jgi:hypothetical protein